MLSRLVMSHSVTPWTAACQAPLSMGILQARILEWVAIPSSRGSSQPRDRTQVSHIAGGFFTIWATSEAQMQTVILQTDGHRHSVPSVWRRGCKDTENLHNCPKWDKTKIFTCWIQVWCFVYPEPLLVLISALLKWKEAQYSKESPLYS